MEKDLYQNMLEPTSRRYRLANGHARYHYYVCTLTIPLVFEAKKKYIFT